MGTQILEPRAHPYSQPAESIPAGSAAKETSLPRKCPFPPYSRGNFHLPPGKRLLGASQILFVVPPVPGAGAWELFLAFQQLLPSLQPLFLPSREQPGPSLMAPILSLLQL